MTKKTHAATALSDIALTLFLTKGNSLKTWAENGILNREMALYKALQPHIARMTIVSFGTADDQDFASSFPGITLITNWDERPKWQYYLSWRTALKPYKGHVPVFKCNQVQGGEFAAAAARLFRARMIARCGYLISDFAEREWGPGSLSARKARLHERIVFRSADHCIVTTQTMANRLRKFYRIPEQRITVNPNSVDTNLFSPYQDEKRTPRSLFFAGRLEEQKNVPNLIRALENKNIALTIAGEGTQREHIAQLAASLKVPVTFLGRVGNESLPVHIARHAAFVLPSLYEGHPKTLIEAMACGAPIVTTRVPGIESLIMDGRTGILADTTPASLGAAIDRIIENQSLAEQLGVQARRFAKKHFSLASAIDRELRLLSKLINPGCGSYIRPTDPATSVNTSADACGNW